MDRFGNVCGNAWLPAGRLMLCGGLFVFPLLVGHAQTSTAPTGPAASAAPTTVQGATAKLNGAIDLAPEIEGMAGRQLRSRTFTIAPGGHLPVHGHKDRPTIELVLQGEVVEIRNGVEKKHQAGDTVFGTKEITHWWENRGTVPVILMPVDIFKP